MQRKAKRRKSHYIIQLRRDGVGGEKGVSELPLTFVSLSF